MQPNNTPQQSGGPIITPDPKLNPQPQEPVTPNYESDMPDGNEQAIIPPEMFPATPQKKHVPVAVIIVTIIVALLLIGATVFIFLYTNRTKDNQQAAPIPETSEEVTPAEGANSGLVDETVKTIDQNLNSLNDSQDFTPSDISDESLGL